MCPLFHIENTNNGGEWVKGGDAGEIQVERIDYDVCILLVLPSFWFIFFYYHDVFTGWGRAP